MINEMIFILISIFYVISLAILDGVFNRLVFRENRKLSYFSETKQRIYKLNEWKYIGLILLVILPIILPTVLILFCLNLRYFLLYLVVLVSVPWDNIFGKIVFDDWFGDTPSIALPIVGWQHFFLNKTLVLRFVALIILLILLTL